MKKEKIFCECCGREIDTEYEELESRIMWNGKVCMCCEECRNVVDEENEIEYDQDCFIADTIGDDIKIGIC